MVYYVKKMTKLVCFLKCGESSTGKVIKFTNEKLEKAREKMTIRKKLNIKYVDCDLPTTVDELLGYHSRCYDNFSNIKAATLRKYEEVCSEGT